MLLNRYRALITPHTLCSLSEGGVPGLRQSAGHFSSGLSEEGALSGETRSCCPAPVDTNQDVPLRKTRLVKKEKYIQTGDVSKARESNVW